MNYLAATSTKMGSSFPTSTSISGAVMLDLNRARKIVFRCIQGNEFIDLDRVKRAAKMAVFEGDEDLVARVGIYSPNFRHAGLMSLTPIGVETLCLDSGFAMHLKWKTGVMALNAERHNRQFMSLLFSEELYSNCLEQVLKAMSIIYRRLMTIESEEQCNFIDASHVLIPELRRARYREALFKRISEGSIPDQNTPELYQVTWKPSSEIFSAQDLEQESTSLSEFGFEMHVEEHDAVSETDSNEEDDDDVLHNLEPTQPVHVMARRDSLMRSIANLSNFDTADSPESRSQSVTGLSPVMNVSASDNMNLFVGQNETVTFLTSTERQQIKKRLAANLLEELLVTAIDLPDYKLMGIDGFNPLHRLRMVANHIEKDLPAPMPKILPDPKSIALLNTRIPSDALWAKYEDYGNGPEEYAPMLPDHMDDPDRIPTGLPIEEYMRIIEEMGTAKEKRALADLERKRRKEEQRRLEKERKMLKEEEERKFQALADQIAKEREELARSGKSVSGKIYEELEARTTKQFLDMQNQQREEQLKLEEEEALANKRVPTRKTAAVLLAVLLALISLKVVMDMPTKSHLNNASDAIEIPVTHPNLTMNATAISANSIDAVHGIMASTLTAAETHTPVTTPVPVSETPRLSSPGLNLPPFSKTGRDSRDQPKMDFVKNMTKHAWTGYVTYAYAYDDLQPVSKSGYNWYNSQNLLNTPVDSLDVLHIMGLHDEFEAAKKLVLGSLNFDTVSEYVSVFETTIRVLGGLLAAFEFDGDVKFVDLAVDLADRMLPAFDTPTGIPLNWIRLSNGQVRPGGSAGLAELGTLQLEFQYLSDVTGNPIYAEKALFVLEQMQKTATDIPGVFPELMSVDELKVLSNRVSVGGNTDSYYEYLLKLWLSTGEQRYFDMYWEAADSIASKLVVVAQKGHVYIPAATLTWGKDGMRVHHATTFEHLACFIGGMFSMGALASNLTSQNKSIWPSHLALGANVTDTCWNMYSGSATGIGGENMDGETFQLLNAGYILRPEAVESLFYMWRFTHDSMYRERAWTIVQALERHCRNEAGYHGLMNANSESPGTIDRQESFFLAETLKYLYLIFADDDTVPLEQYVFNTEAHPLSVRGHGQRKNTEKGHLEIGSSLESHDNGNPTMCEGKEMGNNAKSTEDAALAKKMSMRLADFLRK
ncbi:hypothetical protein HDU98_000117 [Podochytrium sp. JEL0797]|nr:hypothetical protein HDU98_000117 [Podochytrium sp. JEL0797]